MSLIHFSYYSEMLAKITDFYVTAPDDVKPEDREGNPHYDRPAKLLVLLHGYTGNYTDWVTGSPIRELCGKYNLVAVMPSGDNSFYVDMEQTGGKYCSFIGKELVGYIRKRFDPGFRREDTFIGGFSMGGYGAIHVGLSFPETFSKVIGLSNALLVEGLSGTFEGNELANRRYYELIFGDLDRAAQTEQNPKVRIEHLKEKEEKIPEFFLACGMEDPLYPVNLEFASWLKEQGINPVWKAAPGEHNWTFWDSCLEPAIRWALEEKA